MVSPQNDEHETSYEGFWLMWFTVVLSAAFTLLCFTIMRDHWSVMTTNMTLIEELKKAKAYRARAMRHIPFL